MSLGTGGRFRPFPGKRKMFPVLLPVNSVSGVEVFETDKVPVETEVTLRMTEDFKSFQNVDNGRVHDLLFNLLILPMKTSSVSSSQVSHKLSHRMFQTCSSDKLSVVKPSRFATCRKCSTTLCNVGLYLVLMVPRLATSEFGLRVF